MPCLLAFSLNLSPPPRSLHPPPHLHCSLPPVFAPLLFLIFLSFFVLICNFSIVFLSYGSSPPPVSLTAVYSLFGCCRLFFPLICHVRLRRRSSFLYPPLPCALPPSVSRPHHSCCRVHLRTKSSAPLLHIHTVRRLNQSVGCNGARGQMENSDGETKAYWGEIVKRQSRLRSAATWSHKRMLFAA